MRRWSFATHMSEYRGYGRKKGFTMSRYVPLTSFHLNFRCRCGTLTAALLVVAMSSTAAVPQMNMSGHKMDMPMKEIPSPEKLPAPLKLAGIGNSHLAITANPEAQMWFDQ